MALAPEDEEIASQYRKMLSMRLPEGAVMQKMAIGEVPQHIQDAVLSGEDGSSAVESDAQNRSSASFWEEEVDEDEETIEEEVIEDDEEIIEDDGEFEEEEILEEETIDDNTYDNQDNESDSDGPETRGMPETGSNAASNSNSNSNDFENSNSGGDVESQQRVQAYPPQPNMALARGTPEKPSPSPNSCWYWIPCLVLLGLIGAGAGGACWLTTQVFDDVDILISSPRPTPPTMSPSVSVSTEFDAVQDDCKLDDFPNPIDQCLCSGEITKIETDIRDRYLYNLEHFIPDYFEDYNEDISSCTPRNQALVWISSGNDAELTKTERAEKFALVTIYASLGGSKWNDNTNWLANEDVCSWFGVTCDEEKFVEQLVLDGNNLRGMLPSEVSLLEKLQFLMVSRNVISGPMPVSLFSIETLATVDVGYNSITGVIPPAVGNAVSLVSLNVERNAMSGRLTKSIGKASNLAHLNLRSNQFASELPMELFGLQKMIHLDIGDNEFSGTLPDEISKLNSLEALRFGPNLFTGTIPSTIGSLGQMRLLSISGIAGLTGRIPAEFGFQLDNLERLSISQTNVSGNIDTSFGRLPSLISLNFSNNQLRSVIPSELGNLVNLVTLDLENNFLDGQIPDTIGNIQTLEELRLNGNLLRGGIPISFGNLVSLKIMQLEANKLEDRVADEICSLRDDLLDVFVVDCPIEIIGDGGVESFGVVCNVPDCCTNCVVQQ